MSSTIRQRLGRRTRLALALVIVALLAIPVAASASSSVRYDPCTHIGSNTQNGYTLTAMTTEYIADCDFVDAYRMRYVNLSGNVVSVIDSGTGSYSDSFSRSGYSMYYTQHRAKEVIWGSLWTLNY